MFYRARDVFEAVQWQGWAGKSRTYPMWFKRALGKPWGIMGALSLDGDRLSVCLRGRRSVVEKGDYLILRTRKEELTLMKETRFNKLYVKVRGKK